MTLLRFLDFLKMDKWKDPAYRAYDVRAYMGQTRLVKAMRRVGHTCPFALNQALANYGYKFCGTIEDLNTALCEWYVWERIALREITHWPFRKGRNNNA